MLLREQNRFANGAKQCGFNIPHLSLLSWFIVLWKINFQQGTACLNGVEMLMGAVSSFVRILLNHETIFNSSVFSQSRCGRNCCDPFEETDTQMFGLTLLIWILKPMEIKWLPLLSEMGEVHSTPVQLVKFIDKEVRSRFNSTAMMGDMWYEEGLRYWLRHKDRVEEQFVLNL